MCGITLVLRAISNMLVRNASPSGPMCFRCLMFSLSEPCELLYIFGFITSYFAYYVVGYEPAVTMHFTL